MSLTAALDQAIAAAQGVYEAQSLAMVNIGGPLVGVQVPIKEWSALVDAIKLAALQEGEKND